MKIKDGFILSEVAGQTVVVAVGKMAKQFNGCIKLNPSSALLWKTLQKGATEEQLVETFMNEYDVQLEQAKEDVKEFVANLEKAGFLE